MYAEDKIVIVVVLAIAAYACTVIYTRGDNNQVEQQNTSDVKSKRKADINNKMRIPISK